MSRPVTRVSFLSIVVGFTSACIDAFAPEMVPAAERFEPPAQYREWWAQVEVCSGRYSPFSRVRWYRVPGAFTFKVGGEDYLGFWWPSHDIVLAGARVNDAFTVRHEMLHDLLRSGGHPALYFEDRCKHLVGSEISTVDETGKR